MHKYIIKRLLSLIPILIGITFIVFVIMSLTPGDPAQIILGNGATAESIESLKEEMGLNDNVIVQYVRYMSNLVRGDMGRSYYNDKSVAKEIAHRFPNTLIISVLAILFGAIISIPIGVVSATKQYSLLDGLGMILALLGISMPSFWLGLLLIILFSVNLGWLPSGGLETWRGYILPTLTIGASSFALITRTTRSSMLEVIRQDYIKTAYAKGVKKKRVIINHALGNALIPTVTIIGLAIGYLMGGAVLTETIFSFPGIGRLMVDSINAKDTPLVLGCIVVFAISFSIVNLLVDILYAYIDPRIKAQYK